MNPLYRDSLDAKSISGIMERMRRGEITPTELVSQCLARIQSNDETRIRAWVVVDSEGALREAERLTALAKEGNFIGPLHGIPIGVKDIIDVQGMPTGCGKRSQSDVADATTTRVASQDATIVARLRQAGAIILGKTVTTEFACMDPNVTTNPYDISRTPGGSSSGSAAAVATSMCMVALGTQTAGSTLRPASYCGICGFKPTYNDFLTQDMKGIAPVSFHLDHVGFMAQNVADLYTLYQALLPEGSREHSPSRFWIEATDNPMSFRPTLCRLDEFFADETEAKELNAYNTALEKLTKGVHWLPARPLPQSFYSVHHHHSTIMAVEAAEIHREAFTEAPEQYSPKLSQLLEKGLKTRLPDYVAALQHRYNFGREILDMFRTIDYNNDSSHKEMVVPMLVTPTTPSTAPSIDITGDPKFNTPWSYCGLPAISVPCGYVDGLPIGMQIIAPPNKELELLSVAAWCEARLGIFPPQLPT